MMAGIGGCYERVCVGLNAGWAWSGLIEAIDGARMDAGCIDGGYERLGSPRNGAAGYQVGCRNSRS